jgi:DNA-binding NarL/FixJ family response regulator
MDRQKTTLLIVDDEELVCRGILRNFKNCFDQIFFATHPDDAEKILKQTEVTELVCDYYLGDSVPRGTELLAKWRRCYPHIRKAVLYSGTDLSKIIASYGVDFKISKSLPLSSLYKAVAPHKALSDEILV